MMELGATVCKPVNPLCGACPVSSCCAAYKQVGGQCLPHPSYAGGKLHCNTHPGITGMNIWCTLYLERSGFCVKPFYGSALLSPKRQSHIQPHESC
jgi:hypothetical protein